MESTNKLIREACVNKDLTSDFLDRLMILRNNNIYITASVLLKPPFLTEKEAIEDTLNSVKELLDNNLVDHVNVMTMSSKPLTIVRKLEEMGLYKLPSIWSTIEVIKLLGPNYGDRLSFRGLIMGDTLDDTRSAHGCNECSNKIMPQLLKISKYTPKKWKEFIRLANSIDCKCKKEWKKENFEPRKIKNGIQKACEKRPVENEQIEHIIDDIEMRFVNRKSTEISSSDIGRMVLTRLKKIDKVAYIRFASVFLEFGNVAEFKKEIREIE